MSKKSKDTTNGDGAANTASAPVVQTYTDLAEMFKSAVLSYGEQWKLPLADIVGNPKAVLYLLQNGYSQSMTDAAAFSKADKANEDGTAKSDDEIAAMAKEARDKRHAAIAAGNVGHRVGGPKASPVERVMREVAEERLRAIAVARGVAMPKGDVLKAALAKIIDRDPDGIRTEAETRIANARAVAGQMGDDDLFGTPATA